MIALLAAIALHGTPYPTELEAAKSALVDAADCSRNARECGGAIYKVAGREVYLYSGPVSSDRPFAVEIPELAEPAPAGLERVADYHVHICNKHNHAFGPYFSRGDIVVNDVFHMSGYMMDICTGNIRQYVPGVDAREDEEVDFHSGLVIYLTCGRMVGWVDVRRYLRCDTSICP